MPADDAGDDRRWDALFADLEARAAALDSAERAAEVEERARIELAGVGLRDRLRAAVGAVLRVRCAGGLVVAGRLGRVGAGWLLIDEGGGRECLLLQPAVRTVSGLGRLATVPERESLSESRLGVAHALRGVARDRSAVRIRTADGDVLAGTVDRVGQDFVEVAVHAVGEPRRRAAVREVVLVPFAVLVAVQRET